MAIVLGSAISLAYYLRVVAAVWMSAPDEARGSSRVVAPGTARPAIAGGSQEADEVLVAPSTGTGVGWVTAVAVVCAIATIAIGIYPEPLLNVANDAARRCRTCCRARFERQQRLGSEGAAARTNVVSAHTAVEVTLVTSRSGRLRPS